MNPQVRKVVIGDPPQASRAAASAWVGAVSWLVAPLLLGAVVLALVLVRRGPEALFTGLLVVAAALPLLWLLVSVLAPARADRTCPECGAQGLRPIRDDDLQGLQCQRCGYRDESASAWKYAEEGDRPLEPFVLQDRRGQSPLEGRRDPGASA